MVEVVGVVDEGDLDPQLRQRVVQEVVAAAVQRRRGDDVVTGLGEIHDGQRRSRLARATASAPGRPIAVMQPPSSAFRRASSAPCVGFMMRV